MTPPDGGGRVRLDKWLWAARFFKTRSLATDAIDAGKIRLNGERVKPAKELRIDDILSIQSGSQSGGIEFEVRVRGLSDVRHSAGIAQTLYAETEAGMIARQKAVEARKLNREPALAIKGRPTKRDRRDLERLRSGE